MSEISVQVPVRNGGEPFREFLKSLALQDIKSPWELIIADDGSDIPVQNQFAPELELLPDRCSVKVIRLENCRCRPVARNAALEASDAPVGLLMDGDLRFGSELLRRHLEVRRETGAHAVMGKRVNAWSHDSTPWQRWMDSRAMGSSAKGSFPWNYFITGNLSVSCDLLKKAGMFDTEMTGYGGEDTEMGYRLSKLGAVFYWDPSLSVDHLDDVTVRKHSGKMIEYGSTGLRYTLKKHPEVRGLLGSRWVENILAPPVTLAPVRIIVRLMLLAPVYRAALRWAEIFGGPGFVMTYLSVGGCLEGLQGKDPLDCH